MGASASVETDVVDEETMYDAESDVEVILTIYDKCGGTCPWDVCSP